MIQLNILNTLFVQNVLEAFLKLCQTIYLKTPLRCDYLTCAGPTTFTVWSANFQIKLAPLIL